MTINKKALHALAALWILVFHLWIPLTGNTAEQFIVRIGYVGVDIFFFTSAYSLADKSIDYLPFLKNRLVQVYLKFALFVLAAVIYKNYSLVRVVKCLTGLEFFEKGGGAFLWFLPAIMLFYILYPLFLNWKCPRKILYILAVWVISTLILEKMLGYHKIFIFTNRVPVIMAGYWLKTHKMPRWLPFVMLPVGTWLLYALGFMRRLNTPWHETYLCLALVLTVAIAGLSFYIPKNKIVDILAAATLELYGLQMLVGTDLANKLYKVSGSKALTDLLVLVILWGSAVILAKAYDKVLKAAQNKAFK